MSALSEPDMSSSMNEVKIRIIKGKIPFGLLEYGWSIAMIHPRVIETF
jgi:hypothetical protein